MRFPRFLAFAGAAALAGCGPQIGAPPLTIRPVESLPIESPAPTSEVGSPVDPTLTGRLAAFVAAAEAGQTAFEQARGEASRTIAAAAGAPAESEAWTVAQQALSALEAARAPARDAADGIETLRQDPANAGPGSRAAVDAASRRVEAIDAGQAAALAALAARLR